MKANIKAEQSHTSWETPFPHVWLIWIEDPIKISFFSLFTLYCSCWDTWTIPLLQASGECNPYLLLVFIATTLRIVVNIWMNEWKIFEAATLNHQRFQWETDTTHSYYTKAFTFLGEKFLAPAKKLLEGQDNSTHFPWSVSAVHPA